MNHCTRLAEYELQGSSRRPDDFTLACLEHVGQLLSDDVITIFPFTAPETGATCCFIEGL